MDKQVHANEGAGATAPSTSSTTTMGQNAPVVRLPPPPPPTAGPSRPPRIDDSDDEGESSGPDNEILAGLGWMTTPGMPGPSDAGRRRARRSRQRHNRLRREAEPMASMPPPSNASAAPNPAPSSSSDTSGKRKREDEEGQQQERDWTRGSLRSERDYEAMINASEGGNDSATRRLIMEDNNLRRVPSERLSSGQQRFLRWSSQRHLRAPRYTPPAGEAGAPSRQKKSRVESSSSNNRSESQSATRTLDDGQRPRTQRSRAPPPPAPIVPTAESSDAEWAEYWNHPGVTMPRGAHIVDGSVEIRWVRQYRWLESIAPGAASSSQEDILLARQDANAFRRFVMTVASVPGNLEAQWAYHSLQSLVPTGTNTPRLDRSLIGNERAMLRQLRLAITSPGEIHELERWARIRRNNLLGRPGLTGMDFPQAPNRASLEGTWAQVHSRSQAQEAQPSASWPSQSTTEVQMQPQPPRSPASEAQLQPPSYQLQQWPQPPQQQQQWQPPQPTLAWQPPVQQQQWAPYGSTSTQWGQLTSFAPQPGSQGNVPPAGGFTYPAPAPQSSYPYYQGWTREQGSQPYAYPPTGPNQWPQPSGSSNPVAPQNAGAPLSSAAPQSAPNQPPIYSFGQFGPAGAAQGPQTGGQAEADSSSFPPPPPFGPPPPGPPGPAPSS